MTSLSLMVDALRVAPFAGCTDIASGSSVAKRCLALRPEYNALMDYCGNNSSSVSELCDLIKIESQVSCERGSFAPNDEIVTALLLVLNNEDSKLAEEMAILISKTTYWPQWFWTKCAMLECSVKLRQAHGLE